MTTPTASIVALVETALSELDEIREAHPEISALTAGPRLILARALDVGRRQDDIARRGTVAGAASLAGTVVAGALHRRLDLRDVADGRLRDVALALVAGAEAAR